MRAGMNASGYTIIEVMIFLAISGFMFITAASFINGKQAEAEFRQSMNETNGEVLTSINDVTNGYYPNNDDITCTVPLTGQPTTSTGASKQGGNTGCVFMGKIIQFRADDDPHAYTTYSVVGRQYVGAVGSDVPTSFDEAKPALVNAESATSSNVIPWDSEVASAFMPADPGHPIYAIGIFNGFGKYTSTMLSSGSQTGLIVPITSGKTKTDIENALRSPENFDTYLAANPNSFFTVCMDSGRSKFGNLSIGSQVGQRLSSDFKIGGRTEVGC